MCNFRTDRRLYPGIGQNIAAIKNFPAAAISNHILVCHYNHTVKILGHKLHVVRNCDNGLSLVLQIVHHVWMIALTALVTGLVNFIFFPHTALLGASGVVFMMIVLSSFTAARKGEIPVTLILVVIFYLGGEIMDGLFKQDNVSQIAHIVGGLCGLVFGFTVRRGRR